MLSHLLTGNMGNMMMVSQLIELTHPWDLIDLPLYT